YRVPPRCTRVLDKGEVSVLIPARNEARQIGAAIDSVLASRGGAELELLVLDDESTDDTGRIVAEAAARDPRVPLIQRRTSLQGWGKPLACAELAERSSGATLIFMDADVRLASDALARLVAARQRSNAALLSGVPRQVTGTCAERLIVPLIHFILL